MIYLGFVSRILFAIIFLTASITKSHDAAAFAKTIRQLGVTKGLAPIVAWLIITYEAVLGLLFTFGIFPTLSTIAALMLLILFAVVSIRALILRQRIKCNCFGRVTSLLGKQTLLRSVLLIIPVSIYYLSTFYTDSLWWPSTLDTIIPLVSISVAAILLTRWLLIARPLAAFAFERRQDEERVAHFRAQRLLENAQ